MPESLAVKGSGIFVCLKNSLTEAALPSHLHFCYNIFEEKHLFFCFECDNTLYETRFGMNRKNMEIVDAVGFPGIIGLLYEV